MDNELILENARKSGLPPFFISMIYDVLYELMHYFNIVDKILKVEPMNTEE